MAEKFKPVTLVRDGETTVADTATRETELRFNGWRTAPAEKPKPSAPKP